MKKQRLLAAAIVLAVCGTSVAQRLDSGSSPFSRPDFSIPSLALSDGQLFTFAAVSNWVGTAAPRPFLPASFSAAPAPRVTMGSVMPVDDNSKEMRSEVAQRRLFDYAHGEVGVFFGKGSGKFRGDVEAGYIVGEVGDDKFHISAGASYERSNFNFPRSRH